MFPTKYKIGLTLIFHLLKGHRFRGRLYLPLSNSAKFLSLCKLPQPPYPSKTTMQSSLISYPPYPFCPSKHTYSSVPVSFSSLFCKHTHSSVPFPFSSPFLLCMRSSPFLTPPASISKSERSVILSGKPMLDHGKRKIIAWFTMGFRVHFRNQWLSELFQMPLEFPVMSFRLL